GSYHERLVLIIGDALDLEHDVAVQQGREVERVPTLEEAPRGTGPQASDADVYEALHVLAHVLAITDLLHDLEGATLKASEGRVPRQLPALGATTWLACLSIPPS